MQTCSVVPISELNADLLESNSLVNIVSESPIKKMALF